MFSYISILEPFPTFGGGLKSQPFQDKFFWVLSGSIVSTARISGNEMGSAQRFNFPTMLMEQWRRMTATLLSVSISTGGFHLLAEIASPSVPEPQCKMI